MKILINTLGVALTTIGTFLVWYFIAQINFADQDAFLRGDGILTVPSPTQEDIKKLKIRIMLSKIGIGLIVFGGLLQIISNYLNEWSSSGITTSNTIYKSTQFYGLSDLVPDYDVVFQLRGSQSIDINFRCNGIQYLFYIPE